MDRSLSGFAAREGIYYEFKLSDYPTYSEQNIIMSLRYSPIVDATPLVADSDDDDDNDSRPSASFGNDDCDGDEKEDNFAGDVVDIRPGAVGRLPDNSTPELASTCGSSNEGSAVCHNLLY